MISSASLHEKFIVLSSSNGTTFGGTIQAHGGALKELCLGLLTNNPDAGCIDRANAAGTPVNVLPRRPEEEREAYDARLHAKLSNMGARTHDTVLACMGWMRQLSDEFLRKGWLTINVHPSLLPKHPRLIGDAVHASVLNAHETESGMTIHGITAATGVDEGPIILQKKCVVLPDDTVESLRARVQALEKEWYPRVLEDILQGRIDLRAILDGHAKR